MSSASDQVTFFESVDEQHNENLFQQKKWTYVTDSSSANGQFTGQLQFDLNTLSSQGDWVDLSQGVIQFPVKINIKQTLTTTDDFNAPITNVNAAVIKNGFHQFIDSIQVVLGGNTIQSSQIFTNIDANYKILTEWSQDELVKYGPSLGIALDDYTSPVDTNIAITDSLDNVNKTGASGAYINSSTQSPSSIIGPDMTYVRNSGFKNRLMMNNNSTSVTSLAKGILADSQSLLGKSNVANTVSKDPVDIYTQFYLATVRLKDISDSLAKFPLCKSLKGYVYVNYNASTHLVSNTSGGGPGGLALASVTNTSTYGRCCPGMLNIGVDGFSFGQYYQPIQVTFEISGSKSTNLTTAAPTYTNARLVVPYYTATPSIDRALTQKKTFRYNERFVTQFNIGESSNFQGTLTPGITNVKRLIMYPYFTGPGSSGVTTFLQNPLLSPFDAIPSTTSPFAALKDLQVYVGNQPMYQSPVTADWETFMQEVAQQGKDGGMVSDSGSGLLNQRLWNQLYRYYTVNIGRRMDSEDGCSKSVQVSCTNATKCPMTVIAIIWYEKEITVDTASGQVMQKM
jgi:hypothetical protein